MNPILYVFDFVTWHISGSWVIILHRIICALCALLFLCPQSALSHLTIALWALNPVGKKLIYKDQFQFSCGIPCFLLTITSPAWIYGNMFFLMLYILHSIPGYILSFFRVHKYVSILGDVYYATGVVKIVDETYLPPSVAPYDPSKKCRISFGSKIDVFDGKNEAEDGWVYMNRMSSGCFFKQKDILLQSAGHQCHEWDTFISVPAGNGMITLRTEDDKFVGKYEVPKQEVSGGPLRGGDSLGILDENHDGMDKPTTFYPVINEDGTVVFADTKSDDEASRSGICVDTIEDRPRSKINDEGSSSSSSSSSFSMRSHHTPVANVYLLRTGCPPVNWTVIVHEILDDSSEVEVMVVPAAPGKQNEKAVFEEAAPILGMNVDAEQAVVVEPPAYEEEAGPPAYEEVEQ